MAGEDVDWAGLAHHLGQQPVGLGHVSVEREDVVGVEHELQPLPAVQLLDRVRARAHSVVQFAHADSADADLVGELGRASHRRVDDDGGVCRAAPGARSTRSPRPRSIPGVCR